MSRAWLYTGEGLFAKTPSGQIEPSEKDIRDALKMRECNQTLRLVK